jgi:hypothetical protein
LAGGHGLYLRWSWILPGPIPEWNRCSSSLLIHILLLEWAESKVEPANHRPSQLGKKAIKITSIQRITVLPITPKKTYHCQDSSLSKDVPGFCKVISCTKLVLLNAGMHTIKLHCIPECLFSTPYAVAHDTLVR